MSLKKGGRLIKVDRGKISYIFHKTKALAESIGVNIEVGDEADIAALEKVTDAIDRKSTRLNSSH